MDGVRIAAPPLPPEAAPALAIATRLASSGHIAYLAGGCVRDLLLGEAPHDYDVATNAGPERVQQIFRPTREVGAQFGVVLVRSGGRWVEVATFRSDGTYSDGRRPDSVRFGDPREDAARRDFTINGMFIDPVRAEVIDFVGGMADLGRRIVRAIGEAAQRFDEDHLRLLRAVRFAARLKFELDAATQSAVCAAASKLSRVATERIRDELEKILSHPTRSQGFALLCECGLLPHLWHGAGGLEAGPAIERLASLPPGAGVEAAFATVFAGRAPDEVDDVCRRLTFSNDQRENTVWLVRHAADLDDPSRATLAELKRLMAHAAFAALRDVAAGRHSAQSDGAARAAQLDARVRGVPETAVRPAPLITGEDLIAAGVQPGPVFKRVLETLYVRQLDETLTTRQEALAAMHALLAAEA